MVATKLKLLFFVDSAAICALHITYHQAGAKSCFQYEWNRFPSPHDWTSDAGECSGLKSQLWKNKKWLQ